MGCSARATAGACPPRSTSTRNPNPGESRSTTIGASPDAELEALETYATAFGLEVSAARRTLDQVRDAARSWRT